MVWYEEFLHFLQNTMTRPTWFGWYHFLWLGLMITACVLIFIFRKKISRKGLNITLLVLGIALILFEVYKQIIYSFNYNGGGGNSTWSYAWWAFPFQFCSTPMYLMTISGILRKGKTYDCILSYLATFALFGGLIVMIYPGDVFTTMIGINIHTMFWHSSMFIIGFLILATKGIEFKFKNVFKATIVFCIMVLMALIMNIIWNFCGTGATFNMFYISPYLPCTLVILDFIYANTPYFVFLMIYILGFMSIAFAMMGFAIMFDKMEKRMHSRKMFPDNLTFEKIMDILKKEL